MFEINSSSAGANVSEIMTGSSMLAEKSNFQDRSLRTICRALRNQQVVDFVHAAARAGYVEYFRTAIEQVNHLLDEAFGKLALSQSNGVHPSKLVEATSFLLENTFRKHDDSYWFNQGYHEYKTRVKPENDFQQLKQLIPGKTVLDYGCGSGYLAARLEHGGFEVFTTDVLDYRYAEAKHLPFVRMSSATDVPYPDNSIDTVLVQAVLHHIDPDDLPIVIRRLGRIARYVLIKEDTYDLPQDLDGRDRMLTAQPLLRAFTGMPIDAQYQVLVLIDFFANAIAQGIPQMNMPFEFKTISEWRQILGANGFSVDRTLVVGFEPGRVHKSCHVWLLCERTP
jgi:SAM-dependent methyltransferase